MDKKSVEKIAKLSRLQLTDQEVDFYTDHLSMILKHFEELSSIPTDGIEPLVTPTQIAPHIRQDRVEQIMTTDEVLKNAPEKSGNLFKVPPVVG